MLPWLWFLFLGSPNIDLTALDPSQVQVFPLNGIDSPTTLTHADGDLYFGADVLEARPGIYRVIRWEPEPQLGLFNLMVQQEIRGLSGDNQTLMVFSSGKFSSAQKEWRNQILSLKLASRQIVSRIYPEIPNRCEDTLSGCGILGAHQLDDRDWLVMHSGSFAELLVLSEREVGWDLRKEVALMYQKRFVRASEAKLQGTHIYVLIPQKWVLARVALNALEPEEINHIDLESAFDFSSLRKEFRVSNARLNHEGYAEGFAFDGHGNLWVVLNNRGFEFENAPDKIHDRRPKLLLFKAKPSSVEGE